MPEQNGSQLLLLYNRETDKVCKVHNWQCIYEQIVNMKINTKLTAKSQVIIIIIKQNTCYGVQVISLGFKI